MAKNARQRQHVVQTIAAVVSIKKKRGGVLDNPLSPHLSL